MKGEREEGRGDIKLSAAFDRPAFRHRAAGPGPLRSSARARAARRPTIIFEW